MVEGDIDFSKAAGLLKELLPFSIEAAGKYRILTKIEEIIILHYFYCLDKLHLYDEQPAFDKFMNKYTGDYLSNKLNASMYESAVMHYSNYLGNAGNYDMSDIYASEGIKVEIECERMHPLSTLLYCIAWNNERRGKVSKMDLDFCRMAYIMARYKGNTNRMAFYAKWIKSHDKKQE